MKLLRLLTSMLSMITMINLPHISVGEFVKLLNLFSPRLSIIPMQICITRYAISLFEYVYAVTYNWRRIRKGAKTVQFYGLYHSEDDLDKMLSYIAVRL